MRFFWFDDYVSSTVAHTKGRKKKVFESGKESFYMFVP